MAELRLPHRYITPRNETRMGFGTRNPTSIIGVENPQRSISGEFNDGNGENQLPRTGDVERIERIHEKRTMERSSIQRKTHNSATNFSLQLRKQQNRAKLQLQSHKLLTHRKNGVEPNPVSQRSFNLVRIQEDLESLRHDAERLLRYIRTVRRIREL